MENLPLHISIIFILTTFVTLTFFYKANPTTPVISLTILLSWLALQATIGLSDFYLQTDTVPPRFLLLIGPPLFMIIILFTTSKGSYYIDSLNAKTLTLIHVVRVPVELVLFWLSVNGVVPGLMTFEGRNFDILSGLSAPLIYYFGFVKKQLSHTLLLLWNFICLALLLNIVINAVLSAPFPFQKFAFDQPNVAVLYFPFVWLPSCIVPLVLFSHLVTIRYLLNNLKDKKNNPF